MMPPPDTSLRTCRVCNCWDEEACYDDEAGGACYWVELRTHSQNRRRGSLAQAVAFCDVCRRPFCADHSGHDHKDKKLGWARATAAVVGA